MPSFDRRPSVGLQRGEGDPVASCSDEIKEAERQLIGEVLDNDVLLGRGKSIHCHPGNIRYRKVIKARSRLYKSKEGQEKEDIANEVIYAVKDAGGRFLRTVGDTNCWEECTAAVARTKVKQALRDIIKERRQLPLTNKARASSKNNSKTVVLSPVGNRDFSPRSDTETSALQASSFLESSDLKPVERPTNRTGTAQSQVAKTNPVLSTNDVQSPRILSMDNAVTSTRPLSSGISSDIISSSADVDAVVAELTRQRYLEQLAATLQVTSNMAYPRSSVIHGHPLQGPSLFPSMLTLLNNANVIPGLNPQELNFQMTLLQSQQQLRQWQQQQRFNLTLPSQSNACQIEELRRRLRGDQT